MVRISKHSRVFTSQKCIKSIAMRHLICSCQSQSARNVLLIRISSCIEHQTNINTGTQPSPADRIALFCIHEVAFMVKEI